MGKQFVNKSENIVDEMLEGLVCMNPLLCLEPRYRIVLDADYKSLKEQQVTLLSGGGSGHEPAHAGYIGNNMLTAVVCGDVFASPSVTQILAAIRLITGEPGCLVIVKNYTGDRINFGIAVEEARAEGLKVDMVIVGEDSAVCASGPTGRRGLAGTVLVHKIAAAAAASGNTLEQVHAHAHQVSKAMGTMGVALDSCTLPGQQKMRLLEPNTMELGLGIHGEPGVGVSDLKSADEVADTILETILDGSQSLHVDSQSKLVLLVNNLGATSLMELYVLSRRAIKYLKQRNLQISRVYVGNFMTALDMVGCSMTILRLDDPVSQLELLDLEVRAPAWPTASQVDISSVARTAEVEVDGDSSTNENSEPFREKLLPSAEIWKKLINAAVISVLGRVKELTDWDAKVGDGDCGTTLERGANAIKENLGSYPLNKPSATLHEIGKTIRESIGGSSGVFYGLFFTAAGTALMENQSSSEEVALSDVVAALEAGINAIIFYGGAGEGSRTMLDALCPALSAAHAELENENTTTTAVLSAAAQAAELGADRTMHMMPAEAAGRTAYVSLEAATGVPDPGAKAVAFWMRAVADKYAKL